MSKLPFVAPPFLHWSAEMCQIPGGCEARIAILTGLGNANPARREQEAIQAGGRLRLHRIPCEREYLFGAGDCQPASTLSRGRWISTLSG